MAGTIAILGATSYVAQDFTRALAGVPGAEAALFSRRPREIEHWLMQNGIGGRFSALGYDDFGSGQYDTIINFVGAGDPARVAAMGGDIFDVTQRYDRMATDYIASQPGCRYLFLSSGAVYGDDFSRPANAATPACLNINHLAVHEYYGAAKLHAECRHRALGALPIVDIRLFNYFSRRMGRDTGYFIAEVVRAVCTGQVLETTDRPMTRDFLHPSDFFALIRCLLAASPTNAAVDCYSREPIDKMALLAAIQARFGLEYAVRRATGAAKGFAHRAHYYSRNFRASEFGYRPRYTSLQCVVEEIAGLLAGSAAFTPHEVLS